MNRDERRAVALALSAVLCWSTVATGFKLGLAHLAVEQLLMLATWVSWAVFAVAAALRRQFALRSADVAWVVLLGLINPCAYYMVLFYAYDLLPAHIAQPVNYTWSITLAVLAVPILKQRLSLRASAGIGVSYLGVAILLWTSPARDAGDINPTGLLLAIFSTLLWATYWLLNTRLTSQPIPIMLYSFTAALPVVTMVCAHGPGFPVLDLPTLGYGLWIGCLEMGVTFLLWQAALRRSNHAAYLGQLIFLSPFLSLIMIHMVLGEAVAPGAFAGLAVIVAGLWITQRARF